MPSAKRLVIVAAVTSLVGTALLAILALLLGTFDETQARIVGTTAFLSLAGLLALPGGVLLDRAELPVLAWTTIVLAVLSFAAGTTALWGEGELWRPAASLVAVAIAATQTAGLAGRLGDADPPVVQRLFLGATVLVLVVAAMANAAIWNAIRVEGFYRVLGALAVANVLLVVLQPVLRRGREEAAALRLRLTLADGATTDVEVAAGDFADAAAKAIRRAERDGKRVLGVSRITA